MLATIHKVLLRSHLACVFPRPHPTIVPKYGIWNSRNVSHLVHPLTATEQISQNQAGETATTTNIKVVGWIRSIRRHKTRIFFDVSDGSTPINLQVVSSPDLITDRVRVGCAVSIEGQLVEGRSPPSNSDHIIDLKSHQELHAHTIQVLDPEPVESRVPPKVIEGTLGVQTPRPDLGLLRSETGLAWRHRLPEFAAMLRLRAQVKSLVHDVMRQLGYLEVDTPILTTANCEANSETFIVKPGTMRSKWNSEAVVQPPVYLTGSAQLHLEALVLGLGKVYTLGPAFRAESSNTRHHLAEFHMLELESVHLRSVDLLCDEIETVIRLIIGEFLELVQSTAGQAGTIQGKSDLAHIDLASVQSSLSSEQNWARLPYPGTLDTSCLIEPLSQMKSLLSRPFVRITFEDALHHLCERFGARHPTEDFTKEEERHIVQWFGESRPVFVTDFPASLKPFYCLSSDGVRAEAADLLFPDVGELVGGSVRETDESVLRQRLSTNSPELCANEWYCGLRGLGSAPHGGFGLGFERLLQILLGVHNIRDVTPFPRVMNKIVL
ncbi:hypothetical protein T265_05275 [Opisthorchis viverrini]|uniref:Aminoacyl-transfer RNA synthetases class-II family profile domain-containing protein n=2 Tax=Opisthorchis viverrini TaxID=6198 RepID=A0A074ZL01_OPIVI|nr:hypothetical protein T265_05275 [Opisthorchis viverrini]KER27716.1 hypothetical protein T265_05275 [Opisthorchis viverrini]